MEKVIAISKRMMVQLFTRQAWERVLEGCRVVLPFLRKESSAQVRFIPDFGVRDDHLFLPEKYAIKRHVYIETVALMIAFFLFGAIVVVGLAYLLAVPAFVVLSGGIAFFYLIFMGFKLLVVYTALKTPFVTIESERVERLTDAELPVYSILIPLKDEAKVMEQIVRAMKALDYPTDKLDVIVTVEENDYTTKAAINRVGIPPHWRVLELPDTTPKTKPKALNCAFLQSEGEFLVIYDAEIIPDPDQMKKAYLAFKDNQDIAVFQPRLDHYNTSQNLLTRLFTIEFTFHYDMFLPGLSKFKLPVPLSGHSTHFRMSALRRAGAWDPYNVAEDCEIGIRLFRMGYRSSILDSISYEEAASTLRIWIHQRTRWMKGFMQTSIVHLRYPWLTKREMGGWINFIAFLLTVPGTVLINILNLFSWALLLTWLFLEPAFVQDLYPFLVLYVANMAAIVGGFLIIYLNVIALYRREKFHLLKWWFLMPFYWVLLAYATVRAAKHIVTDPHLWEKTTHGTHLDQK